MKVVLVGAGPSNLFLALKCLEDGHEVELYEKTSGAGKKFLVAGKSGLNLTHGEDLETFSKKYFEQEEFFLSLLKDFSNSDLREWLDSLGVSTFVGSSGRVFPDSFKAAEILKNWLGRLKSFKSFSFFPQHELSRIELSQIEFNKNHVVEFDKVVYALGGASWSKTGSDGKWSDLFIEHDIHIRPFRPMNCGFEVPWSDHFKSKIDRSHLKNIAARFEQKVIRGELMLTPYGLEGTPVYSLSREMRDQILEKGEATIFLDLKPDLSEEDIKNRLEQKRTKDSVSNILRKKLKLDTTAITLLKECTSQEEFSNHLAKKMKNLPLRLHSPRPLEESISTSGGVAMDEINESFALKKLPHHYAIGEMLDWDTITGGYLLQMCFSQAYRVYKSISHENSMTRNT